METVGSAAQALALSLKEQALAGIKALIQLSGRPDDEEDILGETPLRVVKAFAEMTEGYRVTPKEILGKVFDHAPDELVILRDIEFVSLCEHHMLPFIGVAHVCYLPYEKVVGLSKLARLVDCFAKRLQIQERMTQQIAQSLMDDLGAQAAGVVVEGKHSCMACRGVKKPGASMVTSCMLGRLRLDATMRSEFLSLINARR